MADIDTVLERLVTDSAFRQELSEDPAAALASYDLSIDDLKLLASSLDSGDDSQRGVEQRTSKSAVVGLLASLTGGGGGAGSGVRPGGKASGADELLARTKTRESAVQLGADGGSKYTAPINVTATTTIRVGGGDPSLGVAGEPALHSGLKTTEMGDEATRLNSQPQGSVTVPLTSSRQAAGSELPKLDATSKDTAYLNQDAPPDDATLHKLPGKPKPGEITLTRSVAADYDGDGDGQAYDIKNQNPIGVDGAAPLDENKWTGGLKAGDTSLTRSGAGGIDDGADGGVDRKYHYDKAVWNRSADDLAPPGEGEVGAADLHTIKLTNANISERLAPGPGDGDSDGDFLTIEDE